MAGRRDGGRTGASGGEDRIGHYRIVAELGQDELGHFLDAVDERLDRVVVLRVSRPDDELGDAAQEVRARMREGARVASHLNHPNLVTVYEYLPLDEADLVALELVEGDTLEELHARGEHWTVLDIARILARLADAVAAAHAEGVAHGRIGPANVKIRPDGRVKLLDLGLPREIDESGHVAMPDPMDDVRALAALACELLAPPGAEAAGWASLLADSTRARAAFGFLTPVLARALTGTAGAGFGSAGEFRDALLLALESAAGRAGGEGHGIEPSFTTRVIGPAGALAEGLPEDGRSLAALGRVPFSGGRTRLVLPLDLAEKVPPDLQSGPATGSSPHARLFRERRFRVRRPTRLAAAGVVLVVATAAVLRATRAVEPVTPDTPAAGAGATPGAGAGAGMPAVTPGDTAVKAAAVDSGGETGPGPDRPVPTMSARIRVTPVDAVIRQVGRPDSTWRDGAELAIAAGDTILLEFSRTGYVAQRVPFTGSRISVSLVPDSVVALFEANVPAEVFLRTNGGEARLGRTPSVRRLPSGTYRFVFRAPGQPDWQTQMNMTRAGQTFRVAKTDYVTTGGLVATVLNAWAMVSLDGGVERETPATWDDVPVGPHVLRLTREGYRTIVDTVTVPAGQVLRRQYTLQRGS